MAIGFAIRASRGAARELPERVIGRGRPRCRVIRFDSTESAHRVDEIRQLGCFDGDETRFWEETRFTIS